MLFKKDKLLEQHDLTLTEENKTKFIKRTNKVDKILDISEMRVKKRKSLGTGSNFSKEDLRTNPSEVKFLSLILLQREMIITGIGKDEHKHLSWDKLLPKDEKSNIITLLPDLNEPRMI